MLREYLLGRCPSNFKINPFVRAYIISESLVWGAWNFITPIFAIFVVNEISGGNVEVAASGVSVYLVARVIFELFSGRYLLNTNDMQKLLMVVLGIACLSISYIGFSFSHSVISLFYFYFVAGMGLGVSTPAKNALFSTHLDHDKEASEWSFADGAAFIAMAIATMIGGVIAHQFGFRILFILSAVVNMFGMIPYFYSIKK